LAIESETIKCDHDLAAELPWQYFLTLFLEMELFMPCKWRLCSNSCQRF